jgi:putrescine aminotransferase
VALRNIEIIEQEKLVERTREIGPYFAQALASLNDHPIVGETRGMGLIGAIEITNDKKKRSRFKDPGRVGMKCREHSFKNGLIMRACWDTMVLSPPLIITKKEIDELVVRARLALDATYSDVKSEMA